MPNSQVAADSYEQVKSRLDEIVQAVSVEGLDLDDALDLYEEAVKLGMRASELIEQDTQARTLEEPSDGEQNS